MWFRLPYGVWEFRTMETPVSKHCANVTVVVADTDRHLCDGLRVALLAEGYKDIHTVASIDDIDLG